MKKYKLEKPTEYQQKLSELFADFSFKTSLGHYSKRNQKDQEKIKIDIKNGKNAEYAVYNFLKNAGKKVNQPDIEIYKGYQKSYDADLCVGDIELHVKSHIKNNHYPVSWLFQKNDSLLTQKPKNNFLCLVVIDNDNYYMYMDSIDKFEFSEPMKISLRKTKKCLYESSFLK